MRPAFLGAVGWLLLVVALYASALQWVTARKLRDAVRGEAPLNGELDESLACDLISDFAAEHDRFAKFECNRADVVVSGEVARVTGVKVSWEERTYCLARTPRWQVLRHAKGVPCFPTPPAEGETETKRVAAAASAQLNERLEGIRHAMASEARPLKCVGLPNLRRNSVPMLEVELLQRGSTGWDFLTTPWLREAVVRRSPDLLLEAAEKWNEGRPWVAVVTSATREPAGLVNLPERGVHLPTSWRRGRLTGTLTLVDAEAGALLCEAPFSFESSQTLPFVPGLGSQGNRAIAPIVDFPTFERVNADFEARFHTAAMTTLHEMTAYRVWPGLY